MNPHDPNNAHGRRAGETEDNMRTRLMATAPKMARSLSPKPVGFYDVHDLTPSTEHQHFKPVKDGKHHDE
jgi:hypothetical protein